LGEAKLHLVLRALQSVAEVRTGPVFDDADDNEPNGTNIQWMKLSHRSFYDFLTQEAQSYGGQQWTALCLVRAEQRHVEVVLDNFYF
jgi:hypothetical protein